MGWLCFLGRLGLGACLADDMGLGKTAQLLATLLADPVDGPTLVVCPVSVLGNWERELARFAPALRVLVHHGAGRSAATSRRFAERAAGHDVVLTTYSLVARDQRQLAEVPLGRARAGRGAAGEEPRHGAGPGRAPLAAGRRIALTGTPVENRLAELWSLMHVLNPGPARAAGSVPRALRRADRARWRREATELLRQGDGAVHPAPAEDGQDDHRRPARTRSS